jgi:hypothetical protein
MDAGDEDRASAGGWVVSAETADDGEMLAGYIIEYDPSRGEVIERFNGTISAAIEVRNGLMDKAVRYAAIRELEKLGYVVTRPDPGESV